MYDQDARRADEAVVRLREAVYTVVGFGVLGLQQAQVQRRRLQRELTRLAVELDERVEPTLDGIEAELSDELRPLLVHARSAARSVRSAVLR